MVLFSIRDVQNLTGIKAHTLRIWEQRHSILNPRRKQSNHRLYDNNDLKRLLRVAFLYQQGYKNTESNRYSRTPGA
ncbi:MerR family transcriptional regulator [Paraflavitalea speifideaquila]|uniref:MerR family transcriptional regulator n=1 Tax=Paraflavitalea speifideaquila TaxID=3076558 RepID=UPI0033130210